VRRSRLFTIPALLVLLALALVASGCGAGADSDTAAPAEGASSEAPDVSRLVSESFAAAANRSAHYVVDATLTLETDGNADPQLAAFAQNPMTLHIEGDASDKAVTADGSVSFMGQTFTASLLAGEHEVFVNFLGSWYGQKDVGLADLEAQQGAATGSGPSEEELIARLGELFTGDVSEGPLTDGVETWQVDGRLSSDGILKLADEYGAGALGAEERKVVDQIINALTLAIVVGRDDMLPRHFELGFSLSADDFAGFGVTEEQMDGLKSLNLELTADMSDYGKTVSIQAPAQFQPIEKLFGQFLGF
jgi:hypothetical protein